jgi:hypothetical protein
LYSKLYFAFETKILQTIFLTLYFKIIFGGINGFQDMAINCRVGNRCTHVENLGGGYLSVFPKNSW